KKPRGLLPQTLVLENVGEASVHLPCLEERGPIDIVSQFLQRVIREVMDPRTEWCRRLVGLPVDLDPILAGFLHTGKGCLTLLASVLVANFRILFRNLREVSGPDFRLITQQTGDHRNTSRGVRDVDGRTVV